VLQPRRHPFLDAEGPIAFAHRGGGDEAPENTFVAFAAAIALGYRYLETDVHVTRDGVLVAFHDERLGRVTDREGLIVELGIAAVQSADAGYSFTPDGGHSHPLRGTGVRIPQLEEVLTRWPQARVNIDPKTDACILPLAELLDRLGAWERVCIGSFSERRLRRLRALSRGRACTSMGPRAVALARLGTVAPRMPRQGADCIQVPLRKGPIPVLTARFVRAAHHAGLPVHAWTINDETLMHDLLDLDVDGIMSARPRMLRDVFTARGLDLAGASASAQVAGSGPIPRRAAGNPANHDPSRPSRCLSSRPPERKRRSIRAAPRDTRGASPVLEAPATAPRIL
jgi:glycerophosphoryl diester phosphodiesterase